MKKNRAGRCKIHVDMVFLQSKQHHSTMRMKRTILLAVLLTAIATSAQNKRWENNFYLSTGFTNSYYGEDGDVAAFHLGYGLNYYFNDRWSAMPGIAWRVKYGLGSTTANHRPSASGLMCPCWHSTTWA
jgi:outer membrane scaffolding protein for murein synthesis (MipA/OmpV family)